MTRVSLFAALALLAGCSTTSLEDMSLIHRHEPVPDQCRSLDAVKARSMHRWWHFLPMASPQSHENRAHERLVRRAGKAGGNSVQVTAYRAFKGANSGDGIQRVEIEGRALDCPAGKRGR